MTLRDKFILAGAALLLLALTFYVAQRLGLPFEPFWLALPVIAVPLAWVLVRRCPAALIPPLLYVGVFKSTRAGSDVDLRDPTFWSLALLAGTLLFHALLAMSGDERPSLGARLREELGGTIAYLAFVAVVAGSYLYSRAPEYGFTAMTRFVVIGSMIFFAALVLVRDETDVRHLITSTWLIAIIVVPYAWLTRQPEYLADPTRLDVGSLTGLGLVLVLLTPKSMRIRAPRVVLLLSVPWLAAGLAGALARGPAFSCITALAASLIWSKHHPGLVSRKAMVLAVVVLVVPAVFFSWSWVASTTPERFGQKESELSNLLKLQRPGGTTGKRLDLYAQAIQGFTEKPVLGWGIGSFSVYNRHTDARWYPHNLVLLVAMEQGLVGLTAFGVFAAIVVQALRRIARATRGEWLFISWIVLFHWCGAMFSGSFDDHRGLILWCGVALAGWRILKLRARQSQVPRVARPMAPVLVYDHRFTS